MSICLTCSRPSKSSECWNCKGKRERQDAYNLGYQSGFLAGERAKAESEGRAIDIERWRQLVQLCHPDKHGQSKTSTDVSQWLGEIKPK